MLQDEERKKGYKFVVKKDLARWLIFMVIGVLTALIACFVNISIEELSKEKYKFLKQRRYPFFFFLILTLNVSRLAVERFTSLTKIFLFIIVIDDCIVNNKGDCLWIPYLLWAILNIIPVLIGSVLVTYIEPVAAGSGIPQVKCYLNGIKVPRVVRIKTLVVKIIGVVTTVVGGLAGGKVKQNIQFFFVMLYI